MFDIIIIGAGTAGMTAAIYAKRAGKSVLLFEKQSFGGQIVYAPSVENFPAVGKISGTELADKMFSQVTELQTEIKFDEVIKIEEHGSVKTVKTETDSFECRAVILATGAARRKLGAENEEKFEGRGVSYCAVCDGAFFKGKTAAVIGGGNSAVTEALYLSDICRKVYLINRRAQLRADEKAVRRMNGRENIVFLPDLTVDAINGGNVLESLTLKNTKTGETQTLETDGVFVSIGTVPQLEKFADVIKLDSAGYAAAKEDCTASNGIFAAGDCREKQVRQLTTAAADGAVAAVNACRYIDENF